MQQVLVVVGMQCMDIPAYRRNEMNRVLPFPEIGCFPEYIARLFRQGTVKGHCLNELLSEDIPYGIQMGGAERFLVILLCPYPSHLD